MLSFSSFSDLVNSSITFISFFLLVIYLPAAIVIKAFRYFKRDVSLDERLSIEKSPLFEETRKYSIFTMVYQGLFMVRRIITILVLFLLVKYPIFQMQAILWMALMNSMYQIHFKPLVSREQNLNQVINEITILLVSVGMYDMLDVSISVNKRIGLGYCVIGTISLNVLYNISKAAYNSIVDLKTTVGGSIRSRKSNQVSKTIINDRRYII